MIHVDEVTKRFSALAPTAARGDPDSLRTLGELTHEVIADGDLAAVTRLRLALERLATASQQPEVTGRVAGLDDVLASQERRLITTTSTRQHEQHRQAVRDRVLTTVRNADAPIQPTTIAGQCGIALHQASRALAELVERGELVKAPPPKGSDQRTRWYTAA